MNGPLQLGILMTYINATRVHLLLEEILNNTIGCFGMAPFSLPPPAL